MPALHVLRGRVLELCRYLNAEIYWRRPPGPTERYELWIRQEDGHERKFAINTRTMPARRGHVIALIVKMSTKPPQVVGLVNVSTSDAVNYIRTDPPALLRMWEFVVLPIMFIVMATCLGDAGLVLFVPAALTYLLMASASRLIYRALWVLRIDRALANEAARNVWT